MEYLGIVVILLLFLGIMMVFYPEALWKIDHILDVKNGEPTELYLAWVRVGGTFFIICSVFIVFIVLVGVLF